MPPIRTARNRKPPPAGFDDIEDTLLEFSNKMKDAENASHEGKKKYEMLWPIFQISHQRMLNRLSLPFQTHPTAVYSEGHARSDDADLLFSHRLTIHLRSLL